MLWNCRTVVRLCLVASASLGLSNAIQAAEGSADVHWWERSAQKDQPMPEQLRFRLEGDGNSTRLMGNSEESGYTARSRLFLRKGALTNRLSYMTAGSHRAIQRPFEETIHLERFQRSWGDRLTYDLTEHFNFAVGALTETDSVKTIDRRDTYYGGAGVILLDLEQHVLKFDLFFARQYQKTLVREGLYVSEEIEGFTDNLANPGLEYIVRPVEAVKGTLGAEAFRSLKESKRYRWSALARLDVAVMEHVSVGAQVSMEFDNQPAPMVRKKDVKSEVLLGFGW